MTMKQGNRRQSTLLTMFNEEELELCDILTNFNNFVNKPILYPSPFFPNPPSSALPVNHLVVPNIDPELHTEKVQASSPNSPLPFSDRDSQQSSDKTDREEPMVIVQELRQNEERESEILLEKEEEIKNSEIHYVEGYVFNLRGQWIPSSVSALASSLRQHVGPRGIDDLNGSTEKTSGLDSLQPLDYSSNMVISRHELSKQKRLQRKFIITDKKIQKRNKQ